MNGLSSTKAGGRLSKETKKEADKDCRSAAKVWTASKDLSSFNP